MSDADIGLSPHPDVEYLSRSELLAELADADERLERLHEVPTENRDRLVETWLVQDRRRILAELNRRHIANEAFPLSSPLCPGKAGKSESDCNLPLVSSFDLLPKKGEEPVDWLVEELIPKGALVLLTAPPGSYKTFFSLALGHCVGRVAIGNQSQRTDQSDIRPFPPFRRH
jgi:AAA domain